MEMSPEDAAARIRELESLLARREGEIAELRLSLEVFSSIDTRTGLPNLNAMVDALMAAADVLRRHGEPFSVVGIRFPGLSRKANTETVRHFGAVLGAALREIDRVGVLDGDSYIAVARDCDDVGADALIKRLSSFLDDTSLPPGVEGPKYTFVTLDEAGPIRPDVVVDQIRRGLDRTAWAEVLRLDPSTIRQGQEG